MRTTFLVVAATLICVPAAATAETPLQKETSVWQAFKDKKTEAFSSIFAPNYVGMYDDGLADKAKELNSLKTAKIDSFKIDNFASRMVDKDDMLMTYVVEVKGTMGKEDVSGKYYASSLWHRSGTKWLTAYHSEVKGK
jgi:hypothetical protein